LRRFDSEHQKSIPRQYYITAMSFMLPETRTGLPMTFQTVMSDSSNLLEKPGYHSLHPGKVGVVCGSMYDYLRRTSGIKMRISQRVGKFPVQLLFDIFSWILA